MESPISKSFRFKGPCWLKTPKLAGKPQITAAAVLSQATGTQHRFPEYNRQVLAILNTYGDRRSERARDPHQLRRRTLSARSFRRLRRPDKAQVGTGAISPCE